MKMSLIWATLTADGRRAALTRPAAAQGGERFAAARAIVEAVRAGGDEAVRRYTEQLDGVRLEEFRVSKAEQAAAAARISPKVDAAMRRAAEQIRRFHAAQRPSDLTLEVSAGVRCERRYLALERVGLYVPAGSAPLPSTVLMLAVPAAVAGVDERIVVTPPRRDGSADPGVLHAARLSGATAVYKVGGAQAIAALAFGTASIPRVDKIFGPGNAYVTAAKLLVSQDGVACDLPAGPSELLVVADADADAELVAADLLSQAEHDADSDLVLVTPSAALAAAVRLEVEAQLAALPRRAIAERSLAGSRTLIVDSLDEALEVANAYAPEHLILNVEPEEARRLAGAVRHAGSVFLGRWSPEAAGDYATGTNHVLPTYGLARSYSGVALESFMKSVSFQELTGEGLQDLAATVELLAELEGLTAHRDAVRRRRWKLEGARP
jgi:histidinol dehydrogenase